MGYMYRIEKDHAVIHDLEVICHQRIWVPIDDLELWHQTCQLILSDLYNKGNVHALNVLSCDDQIAI